MNSLTSVGIRMLVCFLAAGAASAATVTTLSVDFESPTFVLGAIGGNPGFTPGQGGWGGFGTNAITDAVAHSGSQSMSTAAGSSATKALDPSLGEYPVAGFFTIPQASDWWVQAWVNIRSGGTGANMTVSNSLGGCPLIQIDGNGVPYVNSCTRHDPNQPSLGAGAFDQWLLLQMVHTADMLQGIEFNITGGSIDLHMTLDQYTGPGTGALQYVVLTGDAYWDDVAAGYGPVPSAVPLPAGMWLFGSGVLGLTSFLRRRPA